MNKQEQERGPSRLGDRAHRSPKPNDKGNSALRPLSQLQKTAGNQALLGMLEAGAIKPKLRVSQPGDADEVEADRVAEQVTSEHSATGTDSSAPAMTSITAMHSGNLHREGSSAGIASAPDDLLQNIGTGRALDPAVRKSMESRFGQDFSGVRIHNDPRAAESARSVSARAFTLGRDVVFDSGEYAPQSSTGKKLLSHELTHVVQQRGTGKSRIQRQSIPREEILRQLQQLDDQLSNSSLSSEQVLEANKQRDRLLQMLKTADQPKTQVKPNKEEAPASQKIPVAVTYTLEGVLGGAGSGGLLPGAGLGHASIGDLASPNQRVRGISLGGEGVADQILPGAENITGRSILRLINPLKRNVAPDTPNVFTRFVGPEEIGGFLDPNRITITGELAPRFGQSPIGGQAASARLSAFEAFQRQGISIKELAEISETLKSKGFAGLGPEEAALLKRVVSAHAEVAGTTEASPLISLTELGPQEALHRLPPVATQRAYVVRVQINPEDVGRVNDILQRTGRSGNLAQELEVVVAEDVGGGGGRILSVAANPAGPLARGLGTAVTWGGRALIVVGAATTVYDVVTAEGPHRREKELKSFGTFAGGTVLGALGVGFCVGAGIATGGLALLLCGLAFGAAGALGGRALGGSVGRQLDQ